MSVFGDILSKIFHGPKAKAAPQAAPATAAPTPAPPVDVKAVLSALAQDAGQTLDWRHSIVDLMKLLSIDSSLANRKELAGELGDTGDSAAMNIWLHKAVMTKLAEDGGIVPQSLR